MQIADSFKGGLPPTKGRASIDIASQLQQQRMRQQRILRLRAMAYWWYPVFLIVLGCAVAIILANTIGLSYPLQVNLVLLGLPFLALMIWRVDFSLLLLAIFT